MSRPSHLAGQGHATRNQPLDRALLSQQLSVFQRRLRRLLFHQYVLRFVAATVASAAAAVALAGPPLVVAVLWLVAATCIGVAVSAGVALWRTPSIDATATAVDERFHLENRLVTALQFADSPDPVSELVASDASAHLAQYSPLDLSLDRQPRGWWIALACLCAIVLVGLASSSRPRALPFGPSASGTPTTADAPGRSSRASEVPQSQSSAQAATVGPAGAALMSRPSSIDPPESGSRSVSKATATTRAGSQAAPGAATTSSDTEGATTRPGDSEATSSGSPKAGPTGGNADPTRLAAEAAGGAGQGSGARGGDGAGTQAGAGGVSGGPRRTSDRQPAPQPPPNSPVSLARYRTARVAAEAAIAQERIPTHLRGLVRDYFLSIQPAGPP